MWCNFITQITAGPYLHPLHYIPSGKNLRILPHIWVIFWLWTGVIWKRGCKSKKFVYVTLAVAENGAMSFFVPKLDQNYLASQATPTFGRPHLHSTGHTYIQPSHGTSVLHLVHTVLLANNITMHHAANHFLHKWYSQPDLCSTMRTYHHTLPLPLPLPLEYEVEGSRPTGRPKRTWKEVVQKDCQARNLNKEDAMDRGRWKKLIKIGWWSGWWVGECFFWYRLTRVVPDKGP